MGRPKLNHVRVIAHVPEEFAKRLRDEAERREITIGDRREAGARGNTMTFLEFNHHLNHLAQIIGALWMGHFLGTRLVGRWFDRWDRRKRALRAIGHLGEGAPKASYTTPVVIWPDGTRYLPAYGIKVPPRPY